MVFLQNDIAHLHHSGNKSNTKVEHEIIPNDERGEKSICAKEKYKKNKKLQVAFKHIFNSKFFRKKITTTLSYGGDWDLSKRGAIIFVL